MSHHPERPCTTCLGKGERVAATHVAADATGLEWFECDRGHTITDNLARTIRTGRVPIAEWFRRVPGWGDN